MIDITYVNLYRGGGHHVISVIQINLTKPRQSGWRSVESCLAIHLWDPSSNPTGGTISECVYVDWVFSPYWTAWVFPGIILWGFPPTSKTEISSSSSLLVWLLLER